MSSGLCLGVVSVCVLVDFGKNEKKKISGKNFTFDMKNALQHTQGRINIGAV